MEPSEKRPFLIGIAGASCSGKTELARHLAARLAAPVLSIDSYYRELSHLSLEERALVNFDEPAAIDEPLFISHMEALARGEEVLCPTYDFATHSRTREVTRIAAAPFIIVEGLFALYWPEVRALLGARVYVDTPDEVCFERRLARDTRERGRTEESVRRQYAATVRPMAELYVWPTRRYAGIIVSGMAPIDQTTASVLAQILPGPKAEAGSWKG